MPDFGKRWKWVSDLGEGGQAHTFLVTPTEEAGDTKFVLKRLKNLDRIERFEREIRACMELEHPNVVHIIDYDKDPKGRPFLVTEYCVGGSLAERHGQSATVLEVLATFRDICAGAAYAQEKGIVHRDIKPENVFFRANNAAVLGDFGICFIDEDGYLTATEEVAGSRWYCAPELRAGRLRDGIPPRAADVYSLGKVLYWMLSRGRMFDREEHRVEEYRLGQDDPLAPEYELINELFDVAIVESPLQRIPSAPELLRRVEELIRVVRAGGHAITLTVPHRCLFCAQGEYEVIADGTQAGLIDRRNLISHQSIANNRVRSVLGWAAPNSPVWLVLVCKACGNVQAFRPDLVPEALKRWRREG
jgi:serine/threonine protein kinase